MCTNLKFYFANRSAKRFVVGGRSLYMGSHDGQVPRDLQDGSAQERKVGS